MKVLGVCQEKICPKSFFAAFPFCAIKAQILAFARSSEREPLYPLTAPAVKPLMNSFCSKKNRTTTGSTARKVPAIIAP